MAIKKILHIIDSINIGGAEKLLCNTIAELTEFEHLIIALSSSNDVSLIPSNVRFICFEAEIKDLPFKRKAYLKLLKEYKPDIVHAHLYFATVFAKWLTPPSIPLVFTQHFEFSKNAEKWYYRLTDRLVSKKRHTCIAVSNAVLQDYLNSTSFKGKTYIQGNYIPDRYFTIGEGKKVYNSGKLRIIALGNIKPIKNQQFILDAFKQLQDLDVSCDIYGDGPQRPELEKQAEDRNLKVFFKGVIEDSSKVLKGYDLYIMPSLTEGFPLALFEAMACSLPVIVSDIPVFHEVLNSSGSYVSLHNPLSLRPIIEKYLSNPLLLQQDGHEMHTLAVKKASRLNYLKDLRTIYENLAMSSSIANNN